MIHLRNKKFLFCLFVHVNFWHIKMYAADHKEIDQELVALAVPGMGDTAEWLLTDSLHCHIDPNIKVHKVCTPGFFKDLGQNYCQKHLFDALKKFKQACIIEGWSQGGATTLQCFAQDSKNPHIKGIVVTGALASGNSAIHHTVRHLIPILASEFGYPDISFIANVPGSDYFLPYIAKLLPPFWFYSPSGTQPIDAIEKIHNTKIPIILTHGTRDPQVSHNDALAMYYALRKNGNNAYLVSVDVDKHIFILDDDYDDPDCHRAHSMTCVTPDRKHEEISPAYLAEKADWNARHQAKLAVQGILKHHGLIEAEEIRVHPDETVQRAFNKKMFAEWKERKDEIRENQSHIVDGIELYDINDQIALSKYQPDHMLYKHHYDALRSKENTHKNIGTVVTIATLIGAAILAKTIHTKYTKRVKKQATNHDSL